MTKMPSKPMHLTYHVLGGLRESGASEGGKRLAAHGGRAARMRMEVASWVGSECVEEEAF